MHNVEETEASCKGAYPPYGTISFSLTASRSGLGLACVGTSTVNPGTRLSDTQKCQDPGDLCTWLRETCELPFVLVTC